VIQSHGLQTPDIAFAIASEVTTYAKLTLFSAVVFTLKDAADEKRMKGMVFIQMNLVSSFIFGVISAYRMEKGQLLLPVGAALSSLFTGINGLRSVVLKKND